MGGVSGAQGSLGSVVARITEGRSRARVVKEGGEGGQRARSRPDLHAKPKGLAGRDDAPALVDHPVAARGGANDVGSVGDRGRRSRACACVQALPCLPQRDLVGVARLGLVLKPFAHQPRVCGSKGDAPHLVRRRRLRVLAVQVKCTHLPRPPVGADRRPDVRDLRGGGVGWETGGGREGRRRAGAARGQLSSSEEGAPRGMQAACASCRRPTRLRAAKGQAVQEERAVGHLGHDIVARGCTHARQRVRVCVCVCLCGWDAASSGAGGAGRAALPART